MVDSDALGRAAEEAKAAAIEQAKEEEEERQQIAVGNPLLQGKVGSCGR